MEILEASFDQDGGTLGRSPEKRKNHLSLPDPDQYISRIHAFIKFENGHYYLSDNSADGTYILNKNIQVYREDVLLADGDRIKIGEYELTVHIPSNEKTETDNHALNFFNEKNASVSSYYDDQERLKGSNGEKLNLDENGQWWSDVEDFEENPEPGRINIQDTESPLHDSFVPPDIAEDGIQPQKIPEDFNFGELIVDRDEQNEIIAAKDAFDEANQDKATDGDFPAKILQASPLDERDDLSSANQKAHIHLLSTPGASVEKPIPPDSVSIERVRQQTNLELFQFFLQAAGIEDTHFYQNEDIPALMHSVGAIFREMVNGLMAILRGRSEQKTQLNVEVTIIKPADNNPLKFFRDVDDTLKQLLTKEQPGFVDAIDAVREGYADIMNHQLAMTAGIQAAVIKLLERFDPQSFAKQYQEGVVFQRKAKSWDAYRQAYTELANEAMEDFFGEPFTRAYEEQIRMLQPRTNENEAAEE